MPAEFRNIIAGQRTRATSGATIEVRNPADTDEVIGLAPASTVEDVRAAIAAAREAQPKWAALTGPERGRVLYRAATLLEGRVDEWAAELTREEGKTRAEARAEVLRAVDIFRYFAGEGWRVGGDVLPADTPHTLLYSIKVPLGVVAIITPWNFPLAIPAWKMAPALVMGNAVVFKPASATPLMGLRLGELLHEAGLPPGVLNVVCGGGGAIGDALVTDERIDGVSFTGSYAVGHALYQKTAARMTRTHLELGGKNPVIVAADADLDKAVGIVVRGGFGLTGQACTATSRVIVEAPAVREFTERLTAAARALTVGPGLAEGVQMGPAVSAAQKRTDLEYVEIARAEGAQVLAGGGVPEGEALRRGHFVQPTVLAGVRPEMRVAQEEIFGPVVGVIEAADLEEAFRIANGIEYGLTASIVTNDLRKALRFAERAEAGTLKVNQPTAGLSVQAPFGGFKHSGSGMFREMGKGAVDFYTRIKTVYLDGQ
ncbi:MAG TPA: aldehyde dehydrogenase family protein [Roseiflexaceae bacterium]|nr:aldehyde dehydrogenase family protein [Roseiflexaceae bacterium]